MILQIGVLAGALVAAPSPVQVRADSVLRQNALAVGALRPRETVPVADTATLRRRAIVYSDAYGTRLTIHRYASYAMLPVFGAQYVLGNRLLKQKEDAFSGARSTPVYPDLRRAHAVVAMGLASIFVVNTTTGLWNMYEGRNDPAARGVRMAHSITMLAADAGFVVAGVMGARATGNTPDDARRHRTVALGSIALATGSALMMWMR